MPAEPGKRERAPEASEALRNRLERDLAVQGDEANTDTGDTGDAGSNAPNEDSSQDGHSDRPTDPTGPASA